MKLSLISILLGLSLISFNTYALESTDSSSQTLQTGQTQGDQTPDEIFLIANKNKPGVKTLPSGLQYKVIVDGKGAMPTDNDLVTVNYEGKLVDGTVFDSSYKRGQPATFPVMGVIPGWTEALKLMKEGSKWELYIPASLAYGEQGAPPAIGSNKTLIFVVELLKVKKQ